MNGNAFPMNLIDSIEKLLRYIIPGFLFVILVKISYPAETLTDFLKTISSTEFYALSPVFGFAIYNIHRVVFWSVDGMCRCYCGLNLMESLQGQALLKKNFPEFAKILYYRWALVHFGLILAELIFIFTFLAEEKTLMTLHPVITPTISFAFFLICFCFYWHLNVANLKLIKGSTKKPRSINCMNKIKSLLGKFKPASKSPETPCARNHRSGCQDRHWPDQHS